MDKCNSCGKSIDLSYCLKCYNDLFFKYWSERGKEDIIERMKERFLIDIEKESILNILENIEKRLNKIQCKLKIK